MSIKEPIEAEIIVKGNPSDVLNNISNVLSLGTSFTNINTNNDSYQITTNYKYDSIQGDILILLFPENEDRTKIIIKSTSTKSIFVLSNSNEIIIEKIKDVIKINNTIISITPFNDENSLNSNTEIKTIDKENSFIDFKKIAVFLTLGIILIISIIFVPKLFSKNISGIENNIYLGKYDNVPAAIRFLFDNKIELANSHNKFYGTYELVDDKLLITLFLDTDTNLTCIMHNNGESITINGEIFKKTASSELPDEILNSFLLKS